MENYTPKNSRWTKYLTGIGIALMTVITTYLVHTNPTLNMASLTADVNNPATDADQIYIPNYSGGVGESGLLEVKIKQDNLSFDSITFALNYTPVNGLIFENNPIVFGGGTLFEDAAFQMTAAPEDGKLIVTVVLNTAVTTSVANPADPADHDILFKLNTQLNDALPVGQVIDLTISDLALLNDGGIVTAQSTPASTITVQAQEELKVLSAQAIDATHIAVEFSDYLSNIGGAANYHVAPLVVSDVQSGTSYGYDQKYVVLTTTTNQVPGTQYIVYVDALSVVESNQQGKVDANFQSAVFYGYGQETNVLSDFAMTGATVSGYTNIAVQFSDPVKAASVSKDDFNLQEQGGGIINIENVASVSGSTVNLTVSAANYLKKSKTYILWTDSQSSVLRDSDNAILGMYKVAMAGAKDGPRIIGANVTDVGGTYRVTVTFDESIQLGDGGNSQMGFVGETGDAAPGTTLDIGTFPSYNQAISGTTLTFDNVLFNNANANFTYSVGSVSWIKNLQGIPVDPAYKSISFWGLGHSSSTNSVGTVQVTKKDQILIPAGTLNFNEVLQADVSIFYNDNTATLEPVGVGSIGFSGSDLVVGTTDPLDSEKHYIVRIVDTPGGSTLAAKDFVLTRSLSPVSATAISSSAVRMTFSENIDERDIDQNDFQINDGAIAVTSISIDSSDYRNVTLNAAAGSFTAGKIYKISIVKQGVPPFYRVFSYEGNALLSNSVFFSGYDTQSAQSSVTLDSIEVVDSQTLRMNFSAALLESSFTPVNLSVFQVVDPTIPTTSSLTVTDITKIDDDTYELNTAIQSAGTNYFVVFNGVKDANGLRLRNTSVKNFFGYQLPAAAVHLVTPSTTDNESDVNVIISGANLDIVEEVRVGTEVMTIASQSATSLTFVLPAGFTAGNYNITLIDQASNSLVFNSAILVTSPEQVLTVQSDQSKSAPYTVPNDGETKAMLWVLVEDPIDLASVSSVVVNLSQIGGPSTVEMVKDSGTQPLNSQWYTYETTVPATVQTQDDPYLLPVEVRKGSETFTGTVSIRVSKDVTQSVAPTIDQIYISPISVSPDGETPVKISAQVSDLDGANTINSVVADLGSIGIGFKPLVAIGEVPEGTELETQFYESEEFTVPDTTETGTYTINVVASDVTGEQTTATLELQVSTSVNGPEIDSDTSYISPRRSIPRDGKTTFEINAYVSDGSGITDIQSVTASFGTIGLPPVALKRDPEASTEGESAWYQATGLTIPNTAPLGTHDIEIVATDSEGGKANLILQIEVTHKDTLGDPPRVVSDRAYTTPRVAVNDGETPITLYAFVQDDDGDIESVIANLSEIGQVATTEETMGGSSETTSDGSCPTGSNALVCMNASVKEGINGQWFILPNVVVSPLTTPSPNPYQVEIIVTDSGGKATSGTIPVYVGSGDSVEDQQELPQVLAAIPTSETTLEVLFNKEISASSISSSGKGFAISSESNINEELLVLGATINASGTVVTLSTSNQVPGKRYTLSVSKDIKDVVGRGIVEGAGNRINFNGFQVLNRAPVLEYIQATDTNMLELEFRDNLKPSSVRSGSSQVDASSQYGISIYESEDTSTKLAVLGVSLDSPGNVLRIKTGPQKADVKYRINIEGLASYDGTALPVAINKGFKGYNLAVVQHLAAANFADLNNDGKVDFADFTIFSSVYGTIYFGTGENVEEAAANAGTQAGQALEPDPNATVPITSEPAGGATP